MDLRDDKLPGLSDQLGEFMSRAADSINAAHNAASTVPAQATLTGRNTGLDLPTAVSGFTGATTVAIVDNAGVLAHRAHGLAEVKKQTALHELHDDEHQVVDHAA